MRMFTGLDAKRTAKQRLKDVERAQARLKKAQRGKTTKFGTALGSAATKLRAEDKQTDKGLRLTVQAYSR